MVQLSFVVSLLLGSTVSAAGLYSKSSPVLEVNSKNYLKLLGDSPHTSIVEFYAPWCGYCKNLQPIYEKVARSLVGLANVAAVNCDDKINAAFCKEMGVQGYPTLKIVRPPMTSEGQPRIIDYHGERTAKAIVNEVTSNINNYVKRLKDKDRSFLKEEGAKALLFSDKPISATIKAIAIDYFGTIKFAQVQNTQKELVKEFSITRFPSFVLLPPDGEPMMHDGPMNKAGIVNFLSKFTKRWTSLLAEDKTASQSDKAGADDDEPSKRARETPVPNFKDEMNPDVASEPDSPIPVSSKSQEVSAACLNKMRPGLCILILVPDPPGVAGAAALNNLAEVYLKHKHPNRKAFVIPPANSVADYLRESLMLKQKIELIAVNAGRGWWRHFNSKQHEFSVRDISAWFDDMRLGEGEMLRIPPHMQVQVFDEDTWEDMEKIKQESASLPPMDINSASHPQDKEDQKAMKGYDVHTEQDASKVQENAAQPIDDHSNLSNEDNLEASKTLREAISKDEQSRSTPTSQEASMVRHSSAQPDTERSTADQHDQQASQTQETPIPGDIKRSQSSDMNQEQPDPTQEAEAAQAAANPQEEALSQQVSGSHVGTVPVNSLKISETRNAENSPSHPTEHDEL